MTDVWPIVPLVGMRETLQSLSEVDSAYTGEQRLKLRHAPRQVIEYSAHLDYLKYARAKQFARNNSGEVHVPIWWEKTRLGDVSSSDTSFTFDTSYADYREGSLVALWTSPTQYAVGTIFTLTGTGITLTGAVGADLIAPYVMPCRKALMPQGVKFSRKPTYIDCSVTFQVTDNADLSGSSSFDTWNSLDVMSDRTVIVTDIAESIVWGAEYIDNGFGPIAVETVKDYPDFGQMLGFFDTWGAKLWARRTWFHNRNGKQKPFWLPSFNPDLQLTADIGSTDTTVTVMSIGTTADYTGRSVMMLLKDGTRLYKSIDSATAGSGTDTLTLSSAFGQAIATTDIDVFCFMSRVRFDTDSVVFDHQYYGYTTSSVNVVEVPA